MSATQQIANCVITNQPWSVRMAESMLRRFVPEAVQWHYEHGLLLLAMLRVGQKTDDAALRTHVRHVVDLLVMPDGTIRTYKVTEYNLDQINPGRVLLALYQASGEERYRQAAALLRRQLATQPRNRSGGFWHKLIYPYQMWLDGIYMAGPFYAEYARRFADPAAFDDIAHQITLLEQHARDPATGLLYHAWDESRQQRWANPATGCSPHFWGRAMGWYAMALVDVLDHFPLEHPRRPELIAIMSRLAEAVGRVQDPATGLWYQVLDQGQRSGNYLEASASCMFVYAIARGVRKGYLAPGCLPVAQRGYQGIVRELITVDGGGLVTLERCCSVSGLGGNPYRDGSFEYYISEKVRANDYKGVGPCIMAALELDV
jgi:unsaturated rhamnogalacturonyl hydrolase